MPAVAQQVATDSVAPRKKVAVVLSGGGAFGAIHVGALKVLEDAGMPVDMVVGTSMGSIVGALYSVGYDSDNIAAMFRSMDWAELFLDRDDVRHLTLRERELRNTYIYERDFYVRDGIDPQPGGVIRGNNVEDVFNYYLQGYTDSLDFQRDLPRQFACIATDLVDDSAAVLTRGSLVKSIRASMSIPGVFTPVRIGDMILVDGGAKNNFAADVARQLGADIVIGVKFDLGLGTDKQYRTLMDVLERSAGSDVSRRARENERYCDLVVRVPVRGFTSGSFTRKAIDTLIVRGDRAMRAKMDSILILKSMLGSRAQGDHSLHLRNIHQLQKPEKEQQGLISNHEDNTLQAALGIRFDTEDIAALQLGARYFPVARFDPEIDLTLRLGSRSMLRVGADIEPSLHKRLGATYEIWFKYHDLYSHGKRCNNLSYLYQNANLKLFSFEAMNFDCELGVGWEHYHVFSELWNENSPYEFERNQHYFNYHARVRYNSEDRHYFTRRGTRAEAQYEYFTDNMARWRSHAGLSVVTAMWQTTFQLSSSTHLRPGIQGRLIFGDDVPIMASNVAGGVRFGKFFRQQLPMAGFWHNEFFDNKLVSASLRLQQCLASKHFILLDGSVAEHGREMKNLFDQGPLWGVSLSYFYNSNFVGPLGASIGWNSYTHRVAFFLSIGYDF